MEYRFNQDEIKEAYGKLPDGLKEIVSDENVVAELSSIARGYNMRVDRIDYLIDEVTFVVLGLRKTEDFVTVLSKRTGISEKELVPIAKEIDKKVFSKIRQFTGGVAPSQREDALSSQVNSYSRSVSDNPAANDPYKENLFDEDDSAKVDVVKEKLEKIMVEETKTEDFKEHFAPRDDSPKEEVVEKINSDPYKESIED